MDFVSFEKLRLEKYRVEKTMKKYLFLFLLFSCGQVHSYDPPKSVANDDKIHIILKAQKYGDTDIDDWGWTAWMMLNFYNKKDPLLMNYGLSLTGFSTCENAITGWMISSTRLWLESEGFKWMIDTSCAGSM